jgi:uncharacterized protein
MKFTPIVQQIYAAFGQGDIPAILDQMDDNVQWEKWHDNYGQKAGVPWLKEGHGKEGVMAFFQTIGSMLQFKDFQVLGLMEGSNQVAAEVLVEVDVPGTGGHFKEEEIHLWTFNDAGKVVRFRHYCDTAKFIKAAGL